MLNKIFFKQLKTDHDKSEAERRQIISLSNMVLHDSKRVIFSLHRDDIKTAEASLTEIEGKLVQLEKKFGHNRLVHEGAFKAGVEEYVEAKMFHNFIKGKKLDKIPKLKIGYDSYLAGISDLTGEMVRFGVKMASKKEYGEVDKIKQAIGDILAELVVFDMTGYMRTKYDQAKTNLKKIEQIDYDIKIRM
jgi:translin